MEQESYVGKEKNNRLTKQLGKKLLTTYLPYTSLSCMCEWCESRAGAGYSAGRVGVNTTKTPEYQMRNYDSKIKKSSFFADNHWLVNEFMLVIMWCTINVWHISEPLNNLLFTYQL